MKFITIFIAVATICSIFANAQGAGIRRQLCPCCCDTPKRKCAPRPKNCISVCRMACPRFPITPVKQPLTTPKKPFKTPKKPISTSKRPFKTPKKPITAAGSRKKQILP